MITAITAHALYNVFYNVITSRSR